MIAQTTPPTVVVQAAPAPDSGGDGLIELIIALLQFLGAAVWPLAFLIALWWFREPLKAKINDATTVEGFGVKLLLADALGRAKAIQGDANIKESPDTVEARASVQPDNASHGVTSTSPTIEGSAPPDLERKGTHHLEAEGITTGAPTVGRPAMTIEPPSFDRVAAVIPATAIQWLWRAVEEGLLEVADAYRIPVPNKSIGHLIETLDASDALPRNLTTVIRDLFRVRNTATHPRAEVEFTRDEVMEFKAASEIVAKQLEALADRVTYRRKGD